MRSCGVSTNSRARGGGSLCEPDCRTKSLLAAHTDSRDPAADKHWIPRGVRKGGGRSHHTRRDPPGGGGRGLSSHAQGSSPLGGVKVNLAVVSDSPHGPAPNMVGSEFKLRVDPVHVWAGEQG